MARCFLVNNEGGGFADYVEVPDNSTYQQLFETKVGGDPKKYKIRVTRNGERIIPDALALVLEGDRVSITPGKVTGFTRNRQAKHLRVRR
jgi:hypothetical protein